MGGTHPLRQGDVQGRGGVEAGGHSVIKEAQEDHSSETVAKEGSVPADPDSSTSPVGFWEQFLLDCFSNVGKCIRKVATAWMSRVGTFSDSFFELSC